MSFRTKIGKVTIKRFANVRALPTVTKMKSDPSRILARALEIGLEDTIIIGYDRDGEEYFASSYADGADVLWLMDRARHRLMKIGDAA